MRTASPYPFPSQELSLSTVIDWYLPWVWVRRAVSMPRCYHYASVLIRMSTGSQKRSGNPPQPRRRPRVLGPRVALWCCAQCAVLLIKQYIGSSIGPFAARRGVFPSPTPLIREPPRFHSVFLGLALVPGKKNQGSGKDIIIGIPLWFFSSHSFRSKRRTRIS